MAGILDSMMQGYAEGVLGRNSGVAKENSASNTASAFQRLQEAIASDYSMQKKNFESDPSNKGKSWQMPSSSERFNDQVQAMILSGDPNLQSRGLELMTPDAMDKPTEFQKNFEYMKQSNPGLTEMQYFQMLHPGPASTRVNVNLPKQEQMVSIDDSQKIVMPDGSNPPVGSTYNWVAANGGRTVKTKDQSESSATGEVISQGIKGMEGAQGKTTTDPLKAAIAEYRNQPGIVGDVLNTGLNAAGINPNPADVSFMTRRNQVAMNITRLMSGAAASDQDVARVTNMLPKLTDDAKTRSTKMAAAQAQAQAYVDAARNKGGAAPTQASASSQQPQQRVTKSGVKYTVE